MKFLRLLLVAFVFSASAAEPAPSAATKAPAPQGWMLLVAGLALAGWIAHRRLSYL